MQAEPVVRAYMQGVMDGTVPACKLLRRAVERQVYDLETGAARGLHFDIKAAQLAIMFFSFLKHSKGEWAGKPFVLQPWQVFILWVLFGWKRADGTRRFRIAYLEMPRKNGKTTLLAGIALYLLAADGEPGAEVYSAATKKDQAKLVWSEAVRMVKRAPALAAEIKHWRASDTLSVEATSSKFQPLSADSNTLDGLNVHGALIDELHAHRTRGVVDLLETATSARRQPLQIEITTAGFDQTSICYEHHDYARQILEKSIEDDSWFCFIATIDEGDDWRDPKSWEKANPSWGVSVKPDDIRRKCEKAQKLPAAQNNFKRLHLNVWTQQSTRWIDLQVWAENDAHPIEEEQLAGRLGYGGLDLSSVSDITAWVLVFPCEQDPKALDILPRFWCPEARLTAPDNQYADKYQAWARDGYLEVTPGDGVDYDFVEAQIMADATKYRIASLNVDRLFQAHQVAQHLTDEGLTVFGMGQGFIGMSQPMKEFEARLLGRRLHHGDHPVLRWMADNMAVRADPAGNLKPDKAADVDVQTGARRARKIDGIVALVMALDRAMRPGEASAYADHGIRVIE